MKIDNWDRNKFLPSNIFYEIEFAGYLGWDKNEDFLPIQVSIFSVKGKTKSSKDIAIEFDDISEGLFIIEIIQIIRYHLFQIMKNIILFLHFNLNRMQMYSRKCIRAN